jgi:hypothetical protein
MPPTTTSQEPGMTWLVFALMTVVSWGVYGIFLHSGQLGMQDPVNGRYKAFLFVGFAYFIVAIIAPFLMLVLSGANWKYPVPGMAWSLIAGVAGAVGAFCVLLAFGAKGSPAVVMSIVFAGAPVVNAIVALLQHPPAKGWGSIPTQFWIGILLAAVGGCLVTYYKPGPGAPKKPAPHVEQHTTASAGAPAGVEKVH